MAGAVLEQAMRERARVVLSTAFNPTGPVSRSDLLVGRRDQLNRLLAAVGQNGQSAILFGERGVGKTSLASLLHEFWIAYAREVDQVIPVRTNCEPTSTYASIWTNVTELIQDQFAKLSMPLPTSDSWIELFTEMRNEAANPHNVRRLLDLADKHFIIVIDEFDQVEDPECTQLFASTIKAISDYLVPTTLIIVGVADTVDELIADHASIDRAAIQVILPRMSVDELHDIIARGYEQVGLSISRPLLDLMGDLAQGLPHYAHRFGQEAGYAALDRDSLDVERADIDVAVQKAIDLTHESIRAAYHAATISPKETLFGRVLLACALAPVDDLGFFAAGDIRDPLHAVVKTRRYDIPQYVGHLKALCEPRKGSVLMARGKDWRRRYRFANPLMRPYVVLRGIRDGTVAEGVVRAFTLGETEDQEAAKRRLL